MLVAAGLRLTSGRPYIDCLASRLVLDREQHFAGVEVDHILERYS